MFNNISKKIVQFILKYLTKIYLWRGKPEIILIAGTTNRFWVKEEVVKVLRKKYGDNKVRTNAKNFNAEIGLPLSILRLPSGKGNFGGWIRILFKGAGIAFFDRQIPRYLALEAAFNAPGDIHYILSIIKPKIAIITNITPIYMENFENLEKIRQELAKISQKLPKNGVLILNSDDNRVKTLGEYAQATVVTYGVDSQADYQAKDVEKIINGQNFQVVHNSEGKKLKIKRFGKHHIYAKIAGEIINNR